MSGGTGGGQEEQVGIYLAVVRPKFETFARAIGLSLAPVRDNAFCYVDPLTQMQWLAYLQGRLDGAKQIDAMVKRRLS